MTSSRRIYALSTVAALLILGTAKPAAAQDENTVIVQGHVQAFEKLSTNGVYTDTLLFVWDDDPVQRSMTHLLHCNGNGGGSLANCLYQTAFLGCSITYSSSTVMGFKVERWTCGASAPRDAGACVRLTAQADPISTIVNAVTGQKDQVLRLDTVDVGFSSSCTDK